MNRELPEGFRYIVNGVVATIIHFVILTFNLEYLNFESAGLANIVAASFGITASFLGSRYYVFRYSSGSVLSQASKFSALYVSIALAHGAVLYIWTDLFQLNYRVGFLIATSLQVASSYLGNKFLVFRS
jgi:putative flippase GtrA